LTTEFLLKNKRAYVLSQMRTGKTLCVLWATDFLFHNERIRKVLIICTKTNMRLIWGMEIFENFPHRKYAIAHGTKNERIRAIKSNVEYVIINHDGIKVCYRELIEENFDIVVVDELTAFKNARSDRSKTLQHITSRIRAVWGMTGNVTPNSPTEAFGQAKVVNPNNPFLPRYYSKFRDMVEVQIAPYVWVKKPEADDIVYRILQPAIRYTRAECFDIPPMIHKPIEIEMSQEQRNAYETMKEDAYLAYDRGEINATNSGVMALKLLQISAGAVKDNNGNIMYLDDSPKIEYILSVYEETGKGKLIVASAFRASVERVCETLQKAKVNCKFVHGGISVNRRFDIIREFQFGDLEIMVVQPQAVSHGNCFDATNIIIWHSLVASGETYGQMIDRIISASQTKKQYNEYLIGSKADKHILNILTSKSNMSDGILKLFENRLL
jgi:SNF2 family DNA or RNA helicase